MFDVGFPELVLIFVIALLVLGPQRLPKVASEIGKWVGRARRTAMQLRRQLEREIELNEVIMPQKPPPRPAAEQPPPTDEAAPGAEAQSEEEAVAAPKTAEESLKTTEANDPPADSAPAPEKTPQS